MLVTSASAYMYQVNPFQPTFPSPLSPRSANIHGGSRRVFMTTSPDEGAEKQQLSPFLLSPNSQTASPATTTSPSHSIHYAASSPSANAPLPFAKRSIKKAPSPRQDELNERRRSMFLRKVKDAREDRRFDDIQRLDFLQRQRVWETEQLRTAPSITDSELDEEEDVCDLLMSSNNAAQPTFLDSKEELDEVLQREHEELEALLEYMPVQEASELSETVSQQEVNLWSDDDDYDALFSDLMHDCGDVDGTRQQARDADGDEAMDLS